MEQGPQLSDTVSQIEADGKRYTLVGTAHVSDKSVAEVLQVIEDTRPDVVCVELCDARYKALSDKTTWQDTDIFAVVRSGRTLFLLANLALSAYQRHIGQKLGVKPGAELIAAVEKAQEVGARVELIDRDVHITLKRTWANLGWWKKLGLMSSILAGVFSREELKAEDIEELKQESNLSGMLETLAKEVPEVKAPLIDERDKYMVAGLKACGGENVVGVVGAAHVPGMRRVFDSDIDIEPLRVLPPPSKLVAVLKWVLPIAIVGAFAYGYFTKADLSVQEMLTAWILPNAVFGALFTAIAGGKLLSILTALVASPITSLNPLLGAAMAVGPVEAWLRKPTVADFESVHEDFTSVRGVYRNRVTRVLLVALLSNVGSAIGGLVGFSWLLALLA